MWSQDAVFQLRTSSMTWLIYFHDYSSNSLQRAAAILSHACCSLQFGASQRGRDWLINMASTLRMLALHCVLLALINSVTARPHQLNYDRTQKSKLKYLTHAIVLINPGHDTICWYSHNNSCTKWEYLPEWQKIYYLWHSMSSDLWQFYESSTLLHAPVCCWLCLSLWNCGISWRVCETQ